MTLFTSSSAIKLSLRPPQVPMPYTLIAILLLPILNHTFGLPIIHWSSYRWYFYGLFLGIATALIIQHTPPHMKTTGLFLRFEYVFSSGIIIAFFVYGVMFGGALDILISYLLGLTIRFDVYVPKDEKKLQSRAKIDSNTINKYIANNISARS